MASVRVTNITVGYNDNLWPQWVTSGTGSTTSGYLIQQDLNWRNWVTSTTTTGAYYVTTEDPFADREAVLADRSAEAIARREEESRVAREVVERRHQEYRDRRQAEREAASRRTLERARKIEQAEERAKEMLVTLMTPAQRDQYRQRVPVRVRKPDGGWYAIGMAPSNGVHGNIEEFDEHGCRLGRVCVAPQMYNSGVALPTADGWIGQLLGLTHDAEEFLSHGNWSGRRGCQVPRLSEVQLVAA